MAQPKNRNNNEDIPQLVMVKVDQERVDDGAQCTTCLETFELDEDMVKLDCQNKILANSKDIAWDGSKTKARISEYGLKLIATNTRSEWVFAIATKGYDISGEHSRKENFQFPGSIVFYYEVTITSNRYGYSLVGFTDGSEPPADCVGGSPNSYWIEGYGGKNDTLWLSGKKHELDCTTRAIAEGDVIGSGLLLNSKNELAVFFTVNGILCVKQTPINPTVDRLYPTVNIHFFSASLEANFGDNLVTKPFKYDSGKCPGLIFD